MSIEVMKQALDIAGTAMKDAIKFIDSLKAENASLRQAIAEAEKQEPQPMLYVKDINGNFHEYTKEKGHTENCAALGDDCCLENHLPPSRVGVGENDYTSTTVAWIKYLTGAECKANGECYDIVFGGKQIDGYLPLVHPQPAQPKAEKQEQGEPVAYDDWPEYHEHAMGCGLEDRGITDRYEAMRYGWDEALEKAWEAIELLGPLYTHPQPAQPKREWVGLTNSELLEIEKAMKKYYDYQHQCKTVCLPEFAKAIEAKLKEKNT